MSSFEGKGHWRRKTKFQNKWILFLKRKKPRIYHPRFHIVKNIAYASNDWHWVCKIVNCELYYYSTNCTCTATTSLFGTLVMNQNSCVWHIQLYLLIWVMFMTSIVALSTRYTCTVISQKQAHPQNRPTLKISPPLFWMKLLPRVLFFRKYTHLFMPLYMQLCWARSTQETAWCEGRD